ncbi:hypothetical protein [Peribacillus sp. TH16]|uniref:hypothetical protein n=1 Tax=Peribacillus sp. TH16 TaxID=2798482 RepID=UPI001A92C076|nr:hypothetical protein [Peribacillus sp. TH16]
MNFESFRLLRGVKDPISDISMTVSLTVYALIMPFSYPGYALPVVEKVSRGEMDYVILVSL